MGRKVNEAGRKKLGRYCNKAVITYSVSAELAKQTHGPLPVRPARPALHTPWSPLDKFSILSGDLTC